MIISVYFLKREDSTPTGTTGTLYGPDSITEICKTIELPWKDNEPQVSCIPVGEYEVQRHDSIEHPHTWELQNVPGRSGILIHNGNTENDSLGCIIVGDSFGEIDGLPAVLHSNATLDMLRNTLADNFTINIS